MAGVLAVLVQVVVTDEDELELPEPDEEEALEEDVLTDCAVEEQRLGLLLPTTGLGLDDVGLTVAPSARRSLRNSSSGRARITGPGARRRVHDVARENETTATTMLPDNAGEPESPEQVSCLRAGLPTHSIVALSKTFR